MSRKNLARYAALALAICIGFLLSFQDEATARSKHRPHSRHHSVHRRHYRPPVIRIDPTKFEENICLSMNAYFESDDNLEEMFESQFMIAFVTKHRADEARANESMRLPFVGGFAQTLEDLREHSVCMATYKRWQFSWTMASVCKWCQKWIQLQGVPVTPDDYKWQLAQYAAQVVMEGWAPKDIGLDASFSRAIFYFNPKDTRPKTACKYFYRPLARLAHGELVGGHVFFAFPTATERKKIDEVHRDRKKRCAPVDALPDLVWKNPATLQ